MGDALAKVTLIVGSVLLFTMVVVGQYAPTAPIVTTWEFRHLFADQLPYSIFWGWVAWAGVKASPLDGSMAEVAGLLVFAAHLGMQLGWVTL